MSPALVSYAKNDPLMSDKTLRSQKQSQQQHLQNGTITTTTTTTVVSHSAINGGSLEKSRFVDPLSPLSDPLSPANDPLSPAAADSREGGKKTILLSAQLNRASASRAKSNRAFLNWNVKKAGYLKRYTTDKSIPVMSSIVDDDDDDDDHDNDNIDGDGGGSGRVMTLEDRLRMRMEQLEDTDAQKKQKDAKNVQYTTQKEYIKHLEGLNEELKKCFESDRVRAFKIVVRCCKMIGRNEVPPFFPSMFVLVSEVLDSFGTLVSRRIRNLATVRDRSGRVTFKLPAKFSPADVCDEAKEVCRNWFYKIASIRELDARIYTEMAILSCKTYLTNDPTEIRDTIERIGKTIRGLGDPLVAAFARLYLARKAFELVPHERRYLQQLIDDTLYTIERQCSGDQFDKHIAHHNMTRGEYMELFEPPLEWMFEALGSDAGEQTFLNALRKFERGARLPVVLKSIIVGFDAKYVARSANVLVFYIKECDEDSIPKHQLYRALGEKLVQFAPPKQDCLKLLNEIWKDVTQLENMRDYALLVEVYIEFVCKNFTLREVSILLRDLHKHLQRCSSAEASAVEDELKNILLTVLEYADDFVEVFNLEHFLPIFDRLTSATQVEVSKGMLAAFSRRDKSISADPIIMNSLFDLAKTVHDSINDLTPDDERRDIGLLLSKFVSKINFGTAFEKQLAFYVDVRRAFSSFDVVKEAVVSAVLTMVNQTFTMVKGRHSRKTLNFVKACLAFCHITIPSIDDIFSRLNFYVLAGQMAVVNNLLGQADVLFKIAIETIADIPQLLIAEDGTAIQTEKDLVVFVRYLLSSMVAVPGHPEHGPFYLFKGLVKVVGDYNWSVGSSSAQLEILIDMLKSLSAFYQDRLPYRYAGNSAPNDELFVGDASYRAEIVAIGNHILGQIMQLLANLGQDEDVSAKTKQSLCALELFSVITFQAEPSRDMLLLSYNLWNLVSQQQQQNTDSSSGKPVQQQIKSTLHHLKQVSASQQQVGGSNPYQQLYEKLVKK